QHRPWHAPESPRPLPLAPDRPPPKSPWLQVPPPAIWQSGLHRSRHDRFPGACSVESIPSPFSESKSEILTTYGLPFFIIPQMQPPTPPSATTLALSSGNIRKARIGITCWLESD